MEPLYTVSFKSSYEEYKKYCMYFSYRRVPQIILGVVIGICIAFLAAVAVLSIWIGDTLHCVLFLLYIAILLSIYFLLPRYRIRKAYNSNKHIQDKTITINFFEDRLETEDSSGCAKVMYDEIYRIYETKTNFYIMIATNQGMNVIKANCSDGLIEHLRRLRETIKK